jgi:hypothetical protein
MDRKSYLSIKEASSLSGKADITIRRWLKNFLVGVENEWAELSEKDDDAPTLDEFLFEKGVRKNYQSEKKDSPFSWEISEDLITEEFGISNEEVSNQMIKQKQEVSNQMIKQNEEVLNQKIKELNQVINQKENVINQMTNQNEEVINQKQEVINQKEEEINQLRKQMSLSEISEEKVNQYLDLLTDQIKRKDKMLDDLMKQNSQLNTIVFQLNSGEKAEKKMEEVADDIAPEEYRDAEVE